MVRSGGDPSGEIRRRPWGISGEGSKEISMDQVRDPWVIFRGDLGDIGEVFSEDLVSVV